MDPEELESLRTTLIYMKETLPYYAEVLKDVDCPHVQPEDMAALPITTKEDLKKNPEGFMARSLTPEHVAWTGGTTGNAIPVYYSREELAEMYAMPPEREKKLLGIQVHNTNHGLPLKVPTEVFWLDHFLDANIVNRNLENLISDLTSAHHIPGVAEHIQIISFTSQENLKVLALELLRRGIDVSVPYIFGTGDYISPHWIELVERVFGGRYIDCYANTETAAVATICPRCRYFHFNPTVIPEVIDTETHKPVTKGSGFLVVTTLYPYRKMQLLLRYNTEDIVEIKQCSKGFAFELKGRSEELFRVEDTYVSFKSFLDIVDDIPSIWMREPYCYKPIRVEFNEQTSRINLTCYLTYLPSQYPQKVTQLQNTMTDQFFTVYPELREKVKLTFTFKENLYRVYTWPQPMRTATASQRIITEQNTEEFEEGLFIT